MIKKNSRTKKIVVAILALLILGLAFGIYFSRDRYLSNEPPRDATQAASEETINYGPATEEERQQAETNKKLLEDRIAREASNGDTTEKREVTVFISYAEQSGNQVEINGYISGVFEDSGTCELQLSSASEVVTRSTTGIKDATTTICKPFILNSSDMKAGRWKAVITYTSPTSKGVSQTAEFSVN